MALNRAALLKELRPALDGLFKVEYDKYLNKPQYKMLPVYGKYAIYKTVWNEDGSAQLTTTVAKRLSKEQAEGIMKLLVENDDE